MSKLILHISTLCLIFIFIACGPPMDIDLRPTHNQIHTHLGTFKSQLSHPYTAIDDHCDPESPSNCNTAQRIDTSYGLDQNKHKWAFDFLLGHKYPSFKNFNLQSNLQLTTIGLPTLNLGLSYRYKQFALGLGSNILGLSQIAKVRYDFEPFSWESSFGQVRVQNQECSLIASNCYDNWKYNRMIFFFKNNFEFSLNEYYFKLYHEYYIEGYRLGTVVGKDFAFD